MPTQAITKLVASMLAGEENSLARLISLAENGSPDPPEIMEMLRPHLGKAYRVGVTGPPGAGKSTLIDKLTTVIRNKGLRLGIITVDPSSPTSGGTVLGDRIRLSQHYLDQGVFIRSMATRGSQGGLSKAVAPTASLLDAFGKDIIIIETTGVGQTDLAIKEIADMVVLVLIPGFGDAIQLMKAGLMEIADIIVLNKADLEGAERLVTELKATSSPDRWGFEQSIVATQAINGMGVEELYQAIEKRGKKS